MITGVDIYEDRIQLIVHLEGEEQLFLLVPKENDGSENWERVQEWLDAGNEITDRISVEHLYKDQRRVEYPEIGDQLDALYKAGAFPEDMAGKLKAVKDKYPKPE